MRRSPGRFCPTGKTPRSSNGSPDTLGGWRRWRHCDINSPERYYGTISVPQLTCSTKRLAHLRDWCYVAQHYPEMAGASRHDEEVPQLVETEDSGHQVGTSQTVDQGAGAIDEAAAEDPCYPACWYCPEDCGGGDHGEPPHSQIDSHREPARGVHPQKFEHNAAQRQRPDET